MKFKFKVFFVFLSLYIVISSLFSHCRRDLYKGDIGGIVLASEKWKAPIPIGMVVIPTTRLVSKGHANYEDPFGSIERTKVISVGAFLFDSTLVTNAMYGVFIAKITEDSKELSKDVSNTENQASVPGTSVNTVKEKKSKYIKIYTKEEIEDLRPDSNVWLTDFPHHVDETFAKHYNSHPAYLEYPVIGVTWEAAREFCKWRTRFMNHSREEAGLPPVPEFRLPRSIEFEAAQRGGIPNAKYPWGGPEARDIKGRVMANFKSQPGDYTEAGMNYTTPVRYFKPNGYGCYDMVGNVWEWCEDARYPSDIVDTWDLNSVYIDEEEPAKVVMGGAFNSILRPCGYREYRDKDVAYADVGFRCAMNYFEGSNFEVLR